MSTSILIAPTTGRPSAGTDEDEAADAVGGSIATALVPERGQEWR